MAVDKYVIYDDVNFIKGGCINRNRILVNGEPKYFNIQMQGASPFKLINEVAVCNDEPVINKNLRVLEAAYKKNPISTRFFRLSKKFLKAAKKILPPT